MTISKKNIHTRKGILLFSDWGRIVICIVNPLESRARRVPIARHLCAARHLHKPPGGCGAGANRLRLFFTYYSNARCIILYVYI